MVRQRAYKTQLDPNKKQREKLFRCSRAASTIFNMALRESKRRYEETKKHTLARVVLKKEFNAQKKQEWERGNWTWLLDETGKPLPYTLLESAFDNVDTAYKNFFRRLKTGEKPGFPKEKNENKGLCSFVLRGIKSRHIEEKRIKLPVIGWVKLKERGYLPVRDVKINSVAISNRAGRWFVSVQVEEEYMPKIAERPSVGIDFGLKTLAVVSDGTTFENPKAYKKLLRN